MDSEMLNANLYGRKIKKRRMSNFCETNKEYFVRSLVTDRPIKRPTVSQGLTGSRQSVLSKKKKRKWERNVGCIIHKDRVRGGSEGEEG